MDIDNIKRTLLVSDIHGAYKALIQALERAEFDKDSDKLIFLGDVCDGWPEVVECIDFLSSLPYHDHLIGNHDNWCYRWLVGLDQVDSEEKDLMSLWEMAGWLEEGGQSTADEIIKKGGFQKVYNYLKDSLSCLILDQDLLVHGGTPDPDHTADHYEPTDLMWDRNMVIDAIRAGPHERARPHYNQVFCGHTPTIKLKTYYSTEPVHMSNVWMIDTGAGYDGKLSVMDYKTKEFWQSDPVTELYPGVTAR